MTSSPWQQSGKATALGLLVVLAGALGVLFASADAFDPSRLHVHGAFGDQAGFVPTARLLADGNPIESGLVYPAFSHQPGWRPYMPGHYVVAALAIRWLGWSVFAAHLPNLIGYVVGALALFWAAKRTFGLVEGFLVAALYLMFPAFVTYSFTAMGNMTQVGLSAAACAVFLVLGPSQRAWAMPLLVAIPFLFRQTGALLIVPMAWVLALDRELDRGLLRAALSVAATLLLSWALHAWQRADGMGLPLGAWVAEGRFNYRDALHQVPELSPGEWLSAIGGNTSRNLAETARQFELAPGQPGVVGYIVMLGIMLLCLALGAWRFRRDPIVLGAGLLLAVVVGLMYTTYDVKSEKALRTTMFALPVCLLGLAAALRPSALLRRLTRRQRNVALAGGALALALLGCASRSQILRAGAEMTRGDDAAASAVRVLSRIHTDPTKLLMAPHEMIKSFAVEAYPTRVSFHPANDATFELLCARFDIGTVILHADGRGTQLSREALVAAGLRKQPRRITGAESSYVVWTQP